MSQTINHRVVFIVCGGGLFRGEHFDFDQDLLGKLADGDCRTGGIGRAESFGVNGVHGGEVGHVGEIDSGLDDIVHCQSGGFEDCLHVAERLACLLCDSFGDFAGLGVEGNLAGCEQEGAAVYCLAVRSDGSGALSVAIGVFISVVING